VEEVLLPQEVIQFLEIHQIQYQQLEEGEAQVHPLIQVVLVVEAVVAVVLLVVLEMQEDILLQKEIMVEVEFKHRAHGEVVEEVEPLQQVVLMVEMVELVLQQHQYLDQHLNLFILLMDLMQVAQLVVLLQVVGVVVDVDQELLHKVEMAVVEMVD
jgi:hypothetical protein